MLDRLSHEVGNGQIRIYGSNLSGTAESCLFARVAKAVWPRKTREHLANAAGVSDGTAGNWLSGKHEPDARCAAALLYAIFPHR